MSAQAETKGQWVPVSQIPVTEMTRRDRIVEDSKILVIQSLRTEHGVAYLSIKGEADERITNTAVCYHVIDPGGLWSTWVQA